MSNEALVILQARMSSKRFPGKVLEKISGEPMIIRQINRIKCAKRVRDIVVATTRDQSDDSLAGLLLDKKIEVHRGATEDVFSRYLEILSTNFTPNVVRLTADCPLVIPELVDAMIDNFWRSNCDYLSNTIKPTFPHGLDVEVFSRTSLIHLSSFELSDSEKEHVTLGFHNRKAEFRRLNYLHDKDYSNLRWTVDYPQDLEYVRTVYSNFAGREHEFGLQEIIDLLIQNPTMKSDIPPVHRKIED